MNKYSFTIWPCLTFTLYLNCKHINVPCPLCCLAYTATHLERTFQHLLLMTRKMLALSTVDIYLFTPSEPFQIDRDPSVLDTIPNQVLLGQTQRSITTMYMINSSRGPRDTLWGSYHDGCFVLASLNIQCGMITNTGGICEWRFDSHNSVSYAFFWMELLRAIFDSANSGCGDCVCRCAQMGWSVWCLQLSNCVKQVSRATVNRLQCLRNTSPVSFMHTKGVKHMAFSFLFIQSTT